MIPDEALDAAVDALIASRLGDHEGINGEEFVEAAQSALEAAAPFMKERIMTPDQLSKALAELGYVLERAEDPNNVRTWPEDEAEAYREFRWQEGQQAAYAVRAKKLTAALEPQP